MLDQNDRNPSTRPCFITLVLVIRCRSDCIWMATATREVNPFRCFLLSCEVNTTRFSLGHSPTRWPSRWLINPCQTIPYKRWLARSCPIVTAVLSDVHAPLWMKATALRVSPLSNSLVQIPTIIWKMIRSLFVFISTLKLSIAVGTFRKKNILPQNRFRLFRATVRIYDRLVTKRRVSHWHHRRRIPLD